MPSCATLASSAFRRSFIEVRSWRCHTQRTPAGEIDRPRRFSASAMRTWPQGRLLDGQRHHGLFDLDRRAVLQDRLAPADLLQRQLAAFIVQLLEAVKAVAAVPHHLAGLADVAELLGQFQQPDLGPDDLLLLRHRGLPYAAGRAAVPALVRTAPRPPAPVLGNQLRLSG